MQGSPVDCTKIAIKNLFKNKPDLVISGINLGSNLGKNLIYSGTIAAAYEGTILGISSAAISLDSSNAKEFRVVKDISTLIATNLLKHKLPKGIMLNINVPAIQKKKSKECVLPNKENQALLIHLKEELILEENRIFG